MHRLFVALRPPPAVRAGLLALAGGIPGARWQEDDQLHITLRFIGDVERRVAEEVVIALGRVDHPRIEITLAGVGQFDSRGRPNAVWAGLRPQEALASLHRKIDRLLIRLGLEPERRAYLPHITLARMNAAAGATERFLAAHAGLTSPAFELDHFLLFESSLGAGGARYDAIARYPLR